MLSYHFYRDRPSSLMKSTLKGVKAHTDLQKGLNVGQSLLQGWSFPSNKINTITGKVHAFFNNGKMFGNHFYRGGPSPLMS